MPSSPRPALSHPIPPHPVLSASSDSSNHASQQGPTSPNCGCPSHLALAPLMQCPQELSRPWRIAGERKRAQSLSGGGPPCPEAKLGYCQPRAYLCGGGDPGTTSLPPGVSLAKWVSAHTVVSHEARMRGPSSERAKERRRRDGESSEQGEEWDRQGCEKVQGLMLVMQKTMGRQRRRKDGGGGAEDLSLPAAKVPGR